MTNCDVFKLNVENKHLSMPEPLHILFEKCVEQTPDANALIYEDTVLSYHELNQKATQLAFYLSEQGVRPGSFVHIYISRSPDLIIAILAILKCGAAYVPIEISYPEKLLSYLFNDLKSTCIVTQQELMPSLPNTDRPLVVIDQLDLNASNTFQSHAPSVHSTCMVLYTSGSTGHPKGVMLHHYGFSNHLLWERVNSKYTKNEIILQHASVTFDFAQWEIFTALLNNACLVLTRQEFSYDSDYLIQLIQKHNITIMGICPSLLSLLIEDPDFNKCTSLKLMVSGGEVLTAKLQKRFFEKSNANLINGYGPTETTIFALQWQCQREQEDEKVPVGYPTSDTVIYLLDENFDQVTKGEEGEIFIAGDGVANGYYERDKLNEERFLEDPFYTTSARKMYRTGDIARQRPDGAFEFVGRKDYQVKISGRRIELGEIEHVLNTHPEIKECVVTVQKSDTGNQKLVAWLVAKASSPDERSLKEFMLQYLPIHMVPALFFTIAKFPLTPNGKIDRSALTVEQETELSDSTLTPAETLVSELWHDILGTHIQDIDTNFFYCGGDSLACLDLSVRIEKLIGLKFPLSLLYEVNTIRKQAERIDNNDTSESVGILNISAGNAANNVTLVLVSSIGNNLAHFSELRDCLPEYKILGLSSPTFENSNNLIKEIARFQCEAICSYKIEGDIVLIGYSLGGLIAQELSRQLKTKHINVSSLILIDALTSEMMAKQLQTKKNRATFLKRLLRLYENTKTRSFKDIINFLKESFSRRRKNKAQLKDYSAEIAQLILSKKARLRKFNKQAIEQYKQENYDGNMTLIMARDQSFFSNTGTSFGWGEYVKGKLILKTVSGSHHSILTDPKVKELASIIREQL